MKSAIEEIYGEMYDSQKPRFGKEYWNAIAVTAEKEKALIEFIKDNAEAIKVFEEYQNAEGDILCMEVSAYYKAGFRHGFRIVLDALNDD